MKNIFKYIMAFAIIFTAFSCEEDLIVFDADNGQTALSFSRATATVGVCDPTYDVVLESTTKSSSDRTYSLAISAASTADPSEYAVNPSVTIAAGEFVGSTSVDVDFTQIPEGAARALILDVVASDGAIINTRGSISVNYDSVCVLNEIIIDLQFDQYPEEAGYSLANSDGDVISSGATGSFAGETSFSTGLCLEDGDYTMTFLDSYGDGNNGNANGSWGIIGVSCAGNSDVIDRVSRGDFGAPGSVTGLAALVIPFTLGE
jgi:hypothetical protein